MTPGAAPVRISPPRSRPDTNIKAPAAGGSDGKAVASLVLGIASLIMWCCPLIGLPVAGTGLALGIIARKGPNRGMAIAGVVLSVVGLLLALANAVVGVILMLWGEM